MSKKNSSEESSEYINVIYTMILSQKEKYIYTAGEDEYIYERETNDFKITDKYYNLGQTIYSLILHPFENFIYGAGSKETIIKINKEDHTFKEFQKVHTNDIHMLVISQKNNKIISGGKDKIICIWDLETNSLLSKLDKKLLKCGEIMAIEIHPFTDEIFAVDKIKNLKYYNLEKDLVKKIPLKNKEGFYYLKISSKGNKIVTCGADGELFVIDYKTKKSKKFIGHTDTVSCAVFSKEEKILYSSSFDKKIIIWDIKNGSIITKIKNISGIKVICLGKTNDILFSVDDNATVKSFLLEDKEKDNFYLKKKSLFENGDLNMVKESIKNEFDKSYESESVEEEYIFQPQDFKTKKIKYTYNKLDEIFENVEDIKILGKIIDNIKEYDEYKSIELDYKLFKKLIIKLDSLDNNEQEKKDIVYNYFHNIIRFYGTSENFLCDIFNYKLRKFQDFKITDEIRHNYYNKKTTLKNKSKNKKKSKKKNLEKIKKEKEKKEMVNKLIKIKKEEKKIEEKKIDEKKKKNVLKFFNKKEIVSSTDSNKIIRGDSDDLSFEDEKIKIERKKKIEKKSNKYCIRKTAKKF